MPTFREVTTGQVVTVIEDPSHLSGLARWERIQEEPSAPEPVDYVTPALSTDPDLGPYVPFVDSAEAVDDAQAQVEATAQVAAQAAAELVETREASSDAIEALNADLAAHLGDELPAPDADRDTWVAYAKSQGKTDAELKGKRRDTIRDWFTP